jgi:mono/diheme cytochrome c family protein
MGSLIRLTQAEISDIAAALATVALPATAATPGETLYRTYCATCHLAFASTTKAGATVSRINTAVTANTGGMGFVNTSLTTTQIADIAATLGTITPPVIMDGATLYASYCAGCHNPPGDTSLQNSTKKGLTLARFNAATTTNSSATGMGYLAASLSVDQVNAIITVMPPLPVDGPGLYTAKCSTCHGVLTSSSKGGATVSRINTGIANNPTQMGTLGLSASDISLIAAALAGVTPPTLDGPGLYTANCSSCHGALSVSAKAGPSMTVARIQAGIAANAGMSGFATSLTVPQLTLISDALFALPAPVLDGSGLYAANCASCHNPLLTSTKGGAKAAKIQQEITNKRGSVAGVGGMGAANLVNLSPAQLTLIEQALSTILPPACGSCHPVTHTTLKTGTHTFHLTNTTKVKGVIRTALADTTTCGICHGTGYTTVSNGSLLTHNNGTTNIAITAGANSTTVFGIKTWNATSKSCTPGCHGAKTW